MYRKCNNYVYISLKNNESTHLKNEIILIIIKSFSKKENQINS